MFDEIVVGDIITLNQFKEKIEDIVSTEVLGGCSRRIGPMNDEDHVLLSENLEDQLKAVEWAREQKKKITDDKNRRIADSLMEKMTPMILKNGVQK